MLWLRRFLMSVCDGQKVEGVSVIASFSFFHDDYGGLICDFILFACLDD